MKRIHYGVLLYIIALVCYSCANDQLPENSVDCPDRISYEDTRSLINSSCAYSGCHDGINEANFNSFEGMEEFLMSGRFQERAFDVRDMPPSYATNGPTELTQEEIDLLLCWRENDYSKF